MRRILFLAVLATSLTGCGFLSDPQVSTAGKEAASYAATTYPGWEVVSTGCKNRDSDRDGYVRCNLSVREPKTENIQTPSIECAYGRMLSFAEGCQQPKPGSQ